MIELAHRKIIDEKLFVCENKDWQYNFFDFICDLLLICLDERVRKMSKIKKTVILLTLILASFLLICTKFCKNEDFVNNGEENFKDEIVISVFWPPMLDFVNDTQFKYMKDAHIDLMEYNSDPIFNDPDSVEKMLDLCDKYDIYVTIYDNDAKDWTTLNDEEIQKIAKKWMKYKGVVGFYIKDEPQNANPYGRVTRAIREVFPNAICQMNMFPWGALKDARAHAEDWINSAGYGNVSYLSFDQYPFGVAENSRPDMFYNLDLVRTTGLKYDVKTACYIQSISNMKSYRDPTVSETRYHTSAALAYGIKNIKYFTWITPVERSESFTNAIINPDGTKNARYDGIVDINTKIKAVSGILGRTDAVEIYHSTTQDPSTVKIPDDYFIRPDENCDAIFSLMADKYDKSNYLMIVNKDFINSSKMVFTLSGIELTDVTNGRESKDIIKEKLDVTIEAGGFKLYKITGNNVRPVYEDSDKTNIAHNKPVYSSSSVGEYGWYACKAVDGIRYSTGASQGFKIKAYTTEQNETDYYFMVDLLRDVDFNKIVVYPCGKEDFYNSTYPTSYDIYVSSDRENFDKIASFKLDGELNYIPTFTFDTVKGRYVKIVFTQDALDLFIKGVSFSEVEIYKEHQ